MRAGTGRLSMPDGTAYARHRLLLPAVLACAADVAATLAGQGADYWSGRWAAVDEGNPAARLLLQVHPSLFLLAAVASCIVVAVAVYRLNDRLALVVSFLVTFGHAVAASGWLVRFGVAGVVSGVLLLIAFERLLSWSWHRPARDAS